mgnify:CR=1 FL=1
MAASKTNPGQSTRERIMDAALPLFARHGFAGTSTRAIAKAASVNVATLAYYFDGKEGLYRTVIDRLYQDLWETLPTGEPSSGPEMLSWLARTSWTFCVAHQDPMRLLLRHVLDQGSHADVVVLHHSEPVVKTLQTVVQGFRPDWNTLQTRLFIYGLLHMLMRFAVEDRTQLRVLLGVDTDMSDAELDEAIIGSLEEFMSSQLVRS